MSQKEETLLEIIEELAGTDSRIVAEYLLNTDDEVTVELLTESLDLKITSIRKALYDLEDLELVTHNKTKLPDSGYQLIQWRIIPNNTQKIKKYQREAIKKAQNKLQYITSNSLFHCLNGDSEKITYEDAILHNFLCENCGSELKMFDITSLQQKLVNKIESIAKSLDEL